MKNLEIAALFARTADVLAMQDENPFRILAYRKVARVLEEMPEDVEQLAASDKLEETPGIGTSTAGRIREYLRGGRIAEFEDIWGQVPAGVMEMMRIPSVGPKTAALLWQQAGITSVDELKLRLEKGDIQGIKGIGEKKLEKIKQNLAHLAQSAGRIRIGEALPLAQELCAYLRALEGVERVEFCGSLRRGKETIGDVDIAVAASKQHAAALAAKIVTHPFVAEVLGSGATKTSFRTGNGVQVDVRVVPPESFGAALQYFTGSQAHNVHLRQIALDQGYKLNEWGLFQGDQHVAGRTEDEIYHTLGLSCMPPEMREDTGEIDVARNAWAQAHSQAATAPPRSKGKRKDAPPAPAAPASLFPAPAGGDPFQLVELQDIRGDLHLHTVASDGTKTIEEMVAECKRRGYSYCALTDHSKSQFQANGLRVDRLIEHARAIRAVAAKAQGILVLAGSEVDILADGSLDYEDEVLAQLDWVVASPHAALTQESEAATTRLVRALNNPHVCVIGHPTGRLVPSRRGLEPDMKRVLFAAARAGVAMEINANYHRLDLRDSHARMAVEAGVPLCINTDGHDFTDMDQMLYGVLTARRAWARPENVLNTWPVEKFQKWLQSRKEQAAW